MYKQRGKLFLLGIAIALAPLTGMAAITFDGSGAASNTFQQQQNSPCVIGNPSCNQPTGFTFTSDPNGGNYPYTSPLYQATSPFTTFAGNLIPTAFTLGIDSNIATGQGLQTLIYFQTFLCNSTGTVCNVDTANSYSPATPTPIPDNNNGNGRSDATLKGFALTAGNYYQFKANVGNDTAGMEQFFVIPATSAVPEPSYLISLTVGGALLFLFAQRRKRQNDNVA